MTTAKIILNHDQGIPLTDSTVEALSSLESFVVDTYGTRDPDVTQVFAPHKTLKIKPYLNVDLGPIKAGATTQTAAMLELPIIVPEVNKNILV